MFRAAKPQPNEATFARTWVFLRFAHALASVATKSAQKNNAFGVNDLGKGLPND